VGFNIIILFLMLRSLFNEKLIRNRKAIANIESGSVREEAIMAAGNLQEEIAQWKGLFWQGSELLYL
jgi:hypothetical protein